MRYNVHIKLVVMKFLFIFGGSQLCSVDFLVSPYHIEDRVAQDAADIYLRDVDLTTAEIVKDKEPN